MPRAYSDTSSAVAPPRKKKRGLFGGLADIGNEVADATSAAVHDVAQRVGAFDRGFIAEQPQTAAYVTFNTPETDHAQRLARGLSDGWNWAKATHSFAGVPGALLRPLLHAWRNPDAMARRRGLTLVRSLQSLSPQEQGTLDGSVRASFMGTPETQTIPGVPETQAQQIRAKIAKAMGTSLDKVDSHLWDDYYAPLLGIPGTSLADAQKGGVLRASLAIGIPAGVALLSGSGAGIIPKVFAGLAIAGPPLAKEGGQALEHVPGGHVLREIVSKPLWAVSEAGKGLMMPGSWAARQVLNAAGVSPSDPLYQDVEAVGGFIGGWLLADVGAKPAAALKLARGAPEELVRGTTPESAALLRKHLGGPISGRVAKAFYDVFSKPADQWMRTGPGKRLANQILKTTDPAKAEGTIRSDLSRAEQHLQSVQEAGYGPAEVIAARHEVTRLRTQLGTLGKDPAGLLVERFENMPPPLADALAGSRTPNEVALAVDQYINRLDGPGRAAARTRIGAIDTELKKPDIAGEQASSLISERASLNRQLSFEKTEPLFQTPKSSVIRRLRTATPDSQLGQKLYVLYDPKVRFGMKPLPKVAHLFDDMGQNVFYNPHAPGAPPDVLSHDAEVIIRVGRRLGIPEPRVRGFVQRIAGGFKDQDVFETFVKDFGRAIRDSKSVATDIRERIAQRFDREVYERKKGIISNRTDNGIEEQNVLSWGDSPQPSLSSQFVNHIPLPSLDEMIEATSWIRSKARPLEEARIEAKAAQKRPPLSTLPVLPYKALKTLSSFSTAVFKPLVLVTRIPALLLRIEGEEALRARMLGYPAHVFGRGFAHPLQGPLLPGEIPEDVAPILGSYHQEAFQTIPTTPVWRSVETVEWKPGGREPPQAAWDAMHEQLMYWRTAPEGVELAKRGVDGFLRWIEDTPSGKYWASVHQPILDRTGTTWREWAGRNMQWLAQVTSKDPALKESVVTGQWNRGEASDVQARRANVLGEDAQQEHARLSQDDALHDEQIRQAFADGDHDAVRAFQDEQKVIRDRMRQIDREGKVKTRASVSLDHPQEFTAELKAAWQRGDYEFAPKIVMFEQKPVVDRIVQAGLVRRKVQETLYRPLRSVGRSDIKRVRGGTWKSIYDKEYTRLQSLGHTDAFADAHAKVFAARQTSDIMYDLSARSSAHQFLRNIFWFAPAWQEVLTTWGIKIPSRFYWPVGAAYLAGKTGLMMNLAKDLGLVTTDANGNLQTILPGGNWLFDKLAHTPVHELISFDPGRLNLALGGWPGLSTQYNVALGAAAKKYGGIFGDLSNAFQYLGPEATVAPTPLNDMYEAITHHAPPWEFFSRDYQNAVSDLAYDSALQDARTQVGPPPPLPKETLKMTEKQRQQSELDYRNKWKAWAKEMFSTAGHIHRGHELITFLGHTVFPAPLHTTTAEKEGWDKFFTKDVLGGKNLGKGGFTQEQLDLMNSYISAHPDSAAYRVFRTLLGEKYRDLPFAPKTENALWAQVYTGERKVLSRDDYLQKISAYQSYRMYTGQLQQALDEAGKTAPALLRNGFQRHDALTTYRRNWQFYLSEHPTYDGIVKEGRQALADQYAKEGQPLPLMSFEAERLAELNQLLGEVSKSFLVDGHADQDLRKVHSKVAQLLSEQSVFGPPRSQTSKDIGWYYNTVMTPYWAKVGPLFDKAAKAGEAGLTDVQSQAFDRIRAINNQYLGQRVSHGGAKYPTPEEVMYGNLSGADKETARLKWISQPTTWLSDFQRQTAYAPTQVRKTVTVWAGTPQMRQYTERAINQWNRVSGGDVLKLVDSRQKADVRIDFGQGAILKGTGPLAGQEAQGTTYGGGPGALKRIGKGKNIVVDLNPQSYQQNEAWMQEHPQAIDQLTPEQRKANPGYAEPGNVALIAHELGHALGLAHNSLGPVADQNGVLQGGIMAGGSLVPTRAEGKILTKDFGIQRITFPKDWNAFVAFANGANDKFYAEVQKQNLYASSNAYQDLKDRRDKLIETKARELKVGDQWKLSQMAPYARVMRFDPQAAKDKSFRQASAWAAYIQNQIDTAPSGSKTATKISDWNWFFGGLEKLTDRTSKFYDPQFDGVMKDLSYALAPSGKVRRSGRLLYAAAFFGEFNPTYIPREVLSQGRL